MSDLKHEYDVALLDSVALFVTSISSRLVDRKEANDSILLLISESFVIYHVSTLTNLLIRESHSNQNILSSTLKLPHHLSNHDFIS